jgi:hypothetical protein
MKSDATMDCLDVHINIQSLHYMHFNFGCQHVWTAKVCMQACMHCVECCCVAQSELMSYVSPASASTHGIVVLAFSCIDGLFCARSHELTSIRD